MNESSGSPAGRFVSRRRFLRASVAISSAFLAGPPFALASAAPKKLNIAVVGAAGKGASDTDAMAGERIVALCDADQARLAPRLKKYPDAKGFQDYRKMFDKIGKSLDAVVVSTPDHHHALVCALALSMGKHVYCQKPLTQTVHEARVVRRLASAKKLVTQMGNQGSAGDGLRRAVEVVQAGAIGPVRELHVWSNRPIWPQGLDRPAGEDPVPAELDWDAWLGPASFRPFKEKLYHPFKWRGWFDFGTGALGDMACHTVNMPFRALKLGYPSVVECEDAKELGTETYPKSSRIRFEFPARAGLPELKFWWYDGNPKEPGVSPFRPAAELVQDIVAMHGRLPGSGCLLVGDRGTLFSPDDYGAKFYLKLKDETEYLSGDQHPAVKNIAQTIPRCRGAHAAEWLAGIRGGPMPYSNFEIAGYLTEIILLGCVALRHGVGRKIEWDAAQAKAGNADVSHLVARTYRKGWELPA